MDTFYPGMQVQHRDQTVGTVIKQAVRLTTGETVFIILWSDGTRSAEVPSDITVYSAGEDSDAKVN